MYVGTATVTHEDGGQERKSMYADQCPTLHSLNQMGDRNRRIMLYTDESVILIPKGGRLEVEYVEVK